MTFGREIDFLAVIAMEIPKGSNNNISRIICHMLRKDAMHKV
jgi:hypothetical protein